MKFALCLVAAFSLMIACQALQDDAVDSVIYSPESQLRIQAIVEDFLKERPLVDGLNPELGLGIQAIVEDFLKERPLVEKDAANARCPPWICGKK
uniref:U20-Austrotoxin-Ht1b_2 n=1 Tax=Hickmania troglodytes TaxID=489260 RepID=A0A482Z993_9ARAC